MGRAFAPFAAGLLSATLVACGPIVELPGGGPPPSVYELEPVALPGEDLAVADVTVLIEEPGISGSLRVDRIAIKPSANRVAYFAASKWADRTPLLIHNHILQSLETAGAFRVIGFAAIELPSDYRLKLDVRNFQAEETGAGVYDVKVRILARLITQGPVRIIAEKSFSSDLRAPGAGTESVVATFNEGLDEVVRDMARWLAAALAEAEAAETS